MLEKIKIVKAYTYSCFLALFFIGITKLHMNIANPEALYELRKDYLLYIVVAIVIGVNSLVYHERLYSSFNTPHLKKAEHELTEACNNIDVQYPGKTTMIIILIGIISTLSDIKYWMFDLCLGILLALTCVYIVSGEYDLHVVSANVHILFVNLAYMTFPILIFLTKQLIRLSR